MPGITLNMQFPTHSPKRFLISMPQNLLSGGSLLTPEKDTHIYQTPASLAWKEAWETLRGQTVSAPRSDTVNAVLSSQVSISQPSASQQKACLVLHRSALATGPLSLRPSSSKRRAGCRGVVSFNREKEGQPHLASGGKHQNFTRKEEREEGERERTSEGAFFVLLS